MKKKNKLFVATICYNEIDILPYTLPQSLKYADKVIIINGGADGVSNDGTTEYLNSIKNDKLYLEHGKYGDHTLQNNWDRVQRNRYLEVIEDNFLDENEEIWLFLIDSDETYTDEDWLKIRKYVDLAEKNEQIMIRFPYIYFFKDLNHIITGGGWDTKCHHLSKFRTNFRYWDVSTLLRDEAGRCLTHYPPSKIMEVDDITLYHYSHAMNYEKERQRLFRYYIRGDRGQEVAQSIPNNVNEWNWEDTREKEMVEDKVKKFTGIHPVHMHEYVRKYG